MSIDNLISPDVEDPRCYLIGYNHIDPDPNEEKQISLVLTDVAEHDIVLLEGAHGPYESRPDWYHGLTPTLDALFASGIPIVYNDSPRLVEQTRQLEEWWEKHVYDTGFMGQVCKWWYTSRTEHLMRGRDLHFAQSIANYLDTHARAFQIVGTGHLIAGNIQRELEKRRIAYASLRSEQL